MDGFFFGPIAKMHLSPPFPLHFIGVFLAQKRFYTTNPTKNAVKSDFYRKTQIVDL
ncbi:MULTISPECIES: hypothetical protein [unclassified Flavobacterium]|uniref:hypothetical protein n=1 Tax=unclassified Flavobacterium TaxID=196869 RepID=UPI001F12FDE3|nr:MULTISPECIES: hypothetical protein [unclassified Flavobacterium]UMY65783.1 hypothetical protein MKO97_14995 [Flavobacterium sp. HJ-32-4]